MRFKHSEKKGKGRRLRYKSKADTNLEVGCFNPPRTWYHILILERRSVLSCGLAIDRSVMAENYVFDFGTHVGCN
jgi:hypothetical protein